MKLSTQLCACGCGRFTAFQRQTDTKRGFKRGEPRIWCKGHHTRNLSRRIARTNGYVKLECKGHPRADDQGYVYEHILIAERVLGRYLAPEHQVHHVNRNKHDNRPENLVMCQDATYHSLLHQRMRAIEAGHPPDWRPCMHCRKMDDPTHMGLSGRKAYHRECHREQSRRSRESRKGAAQ